MCKQHATFDGGDHTIIVGKVIDFQTTEGSPLIFSNGKYVAG
jgi:flavin reductase (DIM6/NTAB) family NADH-FMN oxidoreductase RutF